MFKTCSADKLPKEVLKIFANKPFSITNKGMNFENNGSKIFADYYLDKDKCWVNLYNPHPIGISDSYDSFNLRGYNQPLSSFTTKENLDLFSKYCKFKKSNGFICELFKIHPLINQENCGLPQKYFINIKKTCTTLISNKDFIDIIDGKNRNILRKSFKNSHVSLISRDYKDFQKKYNESMLKKDTSLNYLLPDSFDFTKYKEKIFLLEIRGKKSSLLAAGLFFLENNYCEYGLSFVTTMGRKEGAGVRLINDAYYLAKEKNAKRFYLGGGISDSDDDPLFKFKKSLSTQINDYYISPIIYNEKTYHNLVEGREGMNLLRYRDE